MTETCAVSADIGGETLWQQARRLQLHKVSGGATAAAVPRPASRLSAEHLQLGFALQRSLGQQGALHAILAAAPGLAAATDHHGCNLLHLAASEGSATALQQLLSALPPAVAAAAACQGNLRGHNPLHLAAAGGHTDCVSLLLSAEPEAAAAADTGEQWTPLHWAVLGGHQPVVQLLLRAAPHAAAMQDRLRCTALHLALRCRRAEVVRALLSVGPTASHITTLLAAGQAALPFFADLVIARGSLTAEEWARVPSGCPGLGRALPAALDCSPSQAAQLVARLPEQDRRRMQAFALCLARTQRRRGVYLPGPIAGQVLSLFDA